MGYNAAGKSTLVKEYVSDGYFRINRDISKGSLMDQATLAERAIDNGSFKVVLDNTYPNIHSRKDIIGVAKSKKIPIRCVHLTTSLEDAQLNACLRMIRKTGKLLGTEDFKKNTDPNLFPPAAIYHYRKEFQAPSLKEGFSAIEEVPFKRVWGPEYIHKALILDYDGTLRLSTGKQKYPINLSDIKMIPNRKNKIIAYQNMGYYLVGASNQSGISKGNVTEAEVIACFEETNKQLGLNINYNFCPHKVPPITCYCRKPAPGMGALFIEKYKLNPPDCIMIGDMTSDKTFAERCGFQFQFADKFFAS